MSLRALAVLMPVCIALSACGGESSYSEDPPMLVGGPTSGRAIKGVIQQADVDAYQRVGSTWALAATTRTDDTGTFLFPNGLPAGPVRVVVHANAAGTSRMVCDAADGCGDAGLDGGEEVTVNGVVDFGETLPLPTDFEMAAILPPDRTDIFIAVTPATDMAATLAEGLPGGVNARSVGIALNQVAALLGLSSDFYRVSPVDITSATERALATDSALHQALLAAAMATQDSGDMGESMAAYSRRFFQYAGQLPLLGEYSVAALDAAAQQVLTAIGSPAAAVDALQVWVDGFEGNQTGVALSGSYDIPDLIQARQSLDVLDTYLNMAGIDESGSFITTQAPQVQWLLSQQTVNMASLMVESVALVLQTAYVASSKAALPASYDLAVDGGMVVPTGLTAVYTKADDRLTISGTSDAGQTISVTFVITPLLQGLSAKSLTYTAESGASIMNAELIGTLEGSIEILLYDTNVQSLITASTPEEQSAALDALLNSLNVRVTVSGNASLAKFDEPDYRFTGDIVAFAEVDVPALQNADPFVELNIASGSLTSPEGDSIYSLDGVNALNIVIDADSSLDANFGFEAFGLPAMEVNAQGELLGLGELVLEFALALQSSSSLDLTAVLGIIEMLDFSVLELSGSGGLSIPDDGLDFSFLLDGNRFDASVPNGGELGNGGTLSLSYYLTSFNGGFIYAGDSLIGAVTYDWQQLGATIQMIDGTERSYFLGELSGLAPASL